MIEGSKIDFVIDEEDLLRNRFMTASRSLSAFSIFAKQHTNITKTSTAFC